MVGNLNKEVINDETGINLSIIEAEMKKNSEDLDYLKDVFTRRLLEDKQKQALIDNLNHLATNAYLKPFLNEIILVLDRLEQNGNDFNLSIYEEIYDVFEMRGLKKIEVSPDFDPEFAKAVDVVVSDDVDKPTVLEVFRSGYTFNDMVVRPAEVSVVTPK